jgi:hypothetical protein
MTTTSASTECIYCHKHPRADKVCSECKTEEKQAEKFKPVVQAFIDDFPVPAGFTKTTGEGWHNGMTHEPTPNFYQETPWWRSTRFVMIENVEAGIRIACCVSNGPEMHAPWDEKRTKRLPAKPVLSGNGHTCYKGELGWRTFDRHGVSDSFYLGAFGDGDIAQIIQEQLDLIEKARERSKHMISIPGFSYRVHKDELEAMKARLKSGQSQSFTPAGFGTGHSLSTRKSRWAK